jgi:DNA-binding transcriptional LysR family regulator
MNISAAAFDWSLMPSFLAVLEHGSLLGAARRHGRSQPTLGRQVAALETQLGVLLFERTGRGLVPTPAALAIAEQARGMAEAAAAIGRRVVQQSRSATGSVRLSASQTVAVHLLPPLLARLREREPGIALEIVVSNAVSNLLRREADIAIRMLRPTQAGLIMRRVGQVAIGAYAHQDYLRRRGTPRTPADLLRHELLGFDQDDLILRSFARLGMPITRTAFALRSDDHLLLWQALRAGLGIGFAATWLAAREPRLQQVLPELPIPPLPVWLTVHREIRASARIRAVYDFLAQALGTALR